MNNHIFSTLVLEQNPKYVDELEAKYNIQLPPIFKAFVQTFEFGKFNPSPQHLIIHPNRDLAYDGIETTLEKDIIVYFEQGEYYQSPNVMPFATSGFSSGFCIGLSGVHIDNILINFGTIENKFEVVAPNILQFIAELKEIHWDSV